MSTSQLQLYNGALLLCGDRFLSSLTDNVEARRLLDQVWSTGGVRTCLEQAQWHFAMRAIQIDYDPSIEPEWGYPRAFVKPTDWVATSAMCSDEYMRNPLLRYQDEAGYWYSDVDTIYVRYVSDDVTYGLNMNKWPESFTRYVEHYFASRIIKKLSDNEDEENELKGETKKALIHAKNKAAMADATSFPAQGSWSRARIRRGRRDGGNTSGNLIG